ncbi:MAG: hypothetical protein OXI45_12640 [Acidobacteriota bacterium]|nr:hypothetical protein [Acidobacteriota bacterium]MDE2710582.1 hypothetical protein [Acidobacteriota bacterium]MXW71235.1 hypothetical protein [Acidobacteriota bacterium]MXX85529.1 hypothetical protein [Acidobacteriota bacterium]MYE43145.1 hypothetical protein [Acidobacteriota bacterium]
MALDETAPGLGGFFFRRLQTFRFFLASLRFILFFLTSGRAVRRRYAAAERSGGTIWLDHGPFREKPEEGFR